MILLVRDEDAPTVAAAINAFAVEEGLEPLDLEKAAENPLNMLGVLAGPRAIVSVSEDQVVVVGLESLDIAEADEWGTAISAACETEVVSLDVAEDGLRVYVFDGGELDEEIEVALDSSGRTRSARLGGLAESEAGKKELEAGVVASSIPDLLTNALRCLGASSPEKDSVIMLAFRDPLDDDEAVDDEDQDPRFIVEPLGMASLEGKVGAHVSSMHGSVFAISIAGIDMIEGLKLELSGDALSLFTIDEITLDLRTRGAHQLEHRVYKAQALGTAGAGGDEKVILDLADAFLERADSGPPMIDASDLFSSMQRMMSAGETQMINTLSVHIDGIGTRAGTGSLVVGASSSSSSSNAISSAEAAIPVRVTA